MHRTPMGRLRGRRHPLDSQRPVVDGVVTPPSRVLDRASGQTGVERHPNRRRHALGVVGETVLEVGRDRDVNATHHRGRVWARASSAVTDPSSRPSDAANPPLVVASA